MPEEPRDPRAWYVGITRYQWLVLVIASLGWIFDVFEGQIFVASSNEAMPTFIRLEEQASGVTLSEEQRTGRREFYNDVAFACFLVGGALGGIGFGMLGDRIGRKRTMTLTILFYSLFTCLSAFSAEWWHLAGFRFLVAMGVGGEWAVASAMVFEVFPARARAHVGGIFHASSVFGTYLAVAAVTFFIGNAAVGGTITDWRTEWAVANPIQAESVKWRIGFALGHSPRVLIIWIRMSLQEPEAWQAARSRAAGDHSQRVGRIGELFSPALLRNTLVGFSLAAVGMATFWGVHIHGKATMRAATETQLAVDQPDLADDERNAALTRGEMLGMFLTTTGGGLGLLCFGPVTQRIGRRRTFLAYHLAAFAISWGLFGFTHSQPVLYWLLPVFGFLTVGMHAGYAIYFPELYPTRLRGTGSGFCFNMGRIAAAPILYLSGWMKDDWGCSLSSACLLLSLLYLLGVVVAWFSPETRGRDGNG